MHIIVPLLKLLAKYGVKWAKKKVEAALNDHSGAEDVSLGLLVKKKTGLEPGRVFRFTPREYNNIVTILLKIVREKLCVGSTVCRIIGTTTSLPSEMMSLIFYRQMWLEHGKEVKTQCSHGEYVAQRVICNSYKVLKEDVENNESSWEEFLRWCKNSCFDAKILSKDYKQLRVKEDIELHDFMLFGDKFVFGSVNTVTENEIECKYIDENDGDDLIAYQRIAKTLASDDNSTRISNLDEVKRFFENHKPWN